ncbi:complex I subunit 5 family protein [Methylocystis sp. JAN1]|uniref:complex I subunit 5 family protein n=1 Tax=Methylocystis sp. JAN1 TaxID=3397211 RepID=UPI003FA2C0A2
MNEMVVSLLSTFAYGPQTMAVALAAPLVFLLACASPRLEALRPAMLALAPAPALAAAALAADSGPLVLDQMLFPAVFVFDPAGALLLGVSALLWIAAGIYAAASMRDETKNIWFAACWLLTLLGNVAVFMAADVVGFYLAFALVSLPAYGLIVGRGGQMDEAGRLYVSVALLGEAFLIIAFAALALGAPDHSLLISDGVAALAASPWREATIGLLIAGFGAKIGVIPFHIWMPSTYRAASIPVAAVLSGAAVNAGIIGLVRFFPWGVEIAGWGNALLILGMFAAFYGVAIGLTQHNPKTILAYSSVSQMGLVAATLGAGLAAGNAVAAGGAAFYAAHHALAKGGLFLAIGAATRSGRLVWTIPLVALLALSLAGSPPTGGALAKLAIKEPLGYGFVGLLSTLSAIATTLLMLHFVRRVWTSPLSREKTPGLGTIGPWLVVTIASAVIPAFYFMATTRDAPSQLSYRLFWESLWPVLAGAVLAALSWRWIDRAPQAPEGDVAAFIGSAMRPIRSVGSYVERGEKVFQRWPVAAAALIATALTVAGTGLLNR